mmetsp:Transcript_49356/g.89278  ORF Transcript_49356/g.89278 Transcript_49356/m.89278 type:complete len:666 (-) Transcript_49356:121-2118(-)
MVSLGSFFFFLLTGVGLLLAVSIPCARDDGVVEDACSDVEQSSSFVQVRATPALKHHKAKATRVVGPTPVPPPAAAPPPPANTHPDSYPVFPVNCSVHGKPIQMAKADGGFSAHQLDIESGGYTPIFEIKWTDIKGMYSELNACGVNPFDDIIYCVMNAALKSYIVRLSPGRIAFVATLRHETYNTGGFGPKGAYYLATHIGKFTVVNDVHAMIGYKDQFDTGIPSLSKLPMQQPKGWYNTGDVVVVTQDFDGTGASDYLMSMTGKRLQVAKWDGTKFTGSWIIPASSGSWKADKWGENYGAAWSFEGKCFFASNSGAGVYQVPLDKINIKSKDPIRLSRVGSSEFGVDSDGLNCMSQPDPWLTNVRPFDCKVHGDAPIQIVRGSFGYEVKKLSLETGRLSDLYSVPYTNTNPPFENLNAVGINPLDKIVYGCLLMGEAPGDMYIVRFDNVRIEFVAKLQGSFDPIGGTFDTNGRFYIISYPETNFEGYIMAIDDLDQMKGYNLPNSTGIADLTKDTLSIQLGKTMQIADIVSISYPDKENKSVDHIVGVNRDQELVVIKWDGAETKVHELRTNNILEQVNGDHGSKLNWGAAWNYEGRLIFASNDGVGIFEAKSFKDNIGYLILEKVVPSSTVENTDGFNCPPSNPFMGFEQSPVISKMIQYNW